MTTATKGRSTAAKISSREEEAIRKQIDEFVAAWNRHNPQAMSMVYAEDAETHQSVRSRCKVANRNWESIQKRGTRDRSPASEKGTRSRRWKILAASVLQKLPTWMPKLPTRALMKCTQRKTRALKRMPL